LAYLTRTELEEMGFKHLGANVKISDKASIYNPETIEIGNNTRIDDFCVVSGNIKLGNNIHITPLCLIAGGTEGIEMHDFSGIGYHGKIFTQSDDYTGLTLTNSTVDAEFKNEYRAKVIIGKHVIIGAGSLIFPGVEIAEGCSIGAMSLVHKSTEPWGIYIGCPAKRLKDRSKEMLALEKLYLNKK